MTFLSRLAKIRLGTGIVALITYSFVLIIVITVIAAGAPVYWLARDQLEKETWARVAGGGRATLVLLDIEQERLFNIVELAAQRPTLNQLLRENATGELSAYLRVSQIGAGLDALAVYDATGRLLAISPSSGDGMNPPLIQGTDFAVMTAPESQLILLAGYPVADEQTTELLGYAVAGRIFDDEFARQLALDSGFELSLILANRRVATSLGESDLPVNSAAIETLWQTGTAQTNAITLNQTRYYTSLLPITDATGNPVAALEVALSVEELVTAERRALLQLILITALVVVPGSLWGMFIAHRLTAPLQRLTRAAVNLGQGDLITPVPIPEIPTEIAALASALETSRAKNRRTLDTLSLSKAWSETLIQSVSEGIVTIDERGIITFFSHGAEQITNWLNYEVIGQPLDHFFRLPNKDDRFTSHIPAYGGQRRINIITHDQREITLSITGARMIPPGSDASQMAIVFRDITEEQSAQKLSSYFLANISHEFRTPLAALNASVELLLDEIENLSPAELRELLNTMHRSVTGLQTLIDNLLESSSIQAGRFRIQRRAIDIGEIINTATHVMQPLLDRREQQLEVATPNPSPAMSVDPTRLTQVLVNLLSNASKYSPIGARIDLSLEITGAGLRVVVADRGAGISQIERANLFQRFVRLGSQDKTGYGIGLGLWVVKVIIEEHGGKVGVEERPGGGSIFWFTIPIRGGDS